MADFNLNDKRASGLSVSTAPKNNLLRSRNNFPVGVNGF